jgi:hypothetical protein
VLRTAKIQKSFTNHGGYVRIKQIMADKSMTVLEREDKGKGGHGYHSPPTANQAANFSEHQKYY